MRLVVDSAAAIRLVRQGAEVAPRARDLAPTLLRSRALAIPASAARGEVTDEEARELPERIWKLPIRLHVPFGSITRRST